MLDKRKNAVNSAFMFMHLADALISAFSVYVFSSIFTSLQTVWTEAVLRFFQTTLFHLKAPAHSKETGK